MSIKNEEDRKRLFASPDIKTIKGLAEYLGSLLDEDSSEEREKQLLDYQTAPRDQSAAYLIKERRYPNMIPRTVEISATIGFFKAGKSTSKKFVSKPIFIYNDEDYRPDLEYERITNFKTKGNTAKITVGTWRGETNELEFRLG